MDGLINEEETDRSDAFALEAHMLKRFGGNEADDLIEKAKVKSRDNRLKNMIDQFDHLTSYFLVEPPYKEEHLIELQSICFEFIRYRQNEKKFRVPEYRNPILDEMPDACFVERDDCYK